jgi:phosphatidylserine decarboxylase
LNTYRHPVIAREAWPFLMLAIALALFVTYSSFGWSIPFWIIAACVPFCFRNPARTIPQKANAVLSPADGRVVAVEKTQDPYANREALKMSVFINVFNVHSNCSPVDGRIEAVKYFPGKGMNARQGGRKAENERNALTIATASGQIVTCVQIAGLIARRILCHVNSGDILSRGQRYGLMRFGSRVDVYLPLSATPKVTVGDKVSATETILAVL